MKGWSQIGVKARTALALGLPRVARAFRHRLGVKLGTNPVRRLKADVPKGPFFGPSAEKAIATPSSAWRDEARYFGWFSVKLPQGRCPDWHLNPFTGGRADSTKPWWQIPDFDSEVGDIKAVWEGSRFDWVLAMAQRAAAGEERELQRLNLWLDDWCEQNPPYFGPNWKCGQEASIRVMHLAMAALILGQARAPKRGLVDLVCVHLRRIAPTMSYAIAQDNNHGTSEAAGLFIGGSWLAKLGQARGKRWQRIGRKWLENRVARLIAEDGSFSQYSVNYHRVMLDTLNMVEVWRRHLELPAFSTLWQRKANAAAEWLLAMVEASTGDAPNIGANDGARLLPLADCDHRDFRPSLQLGMALFAGRRVFPEGGTWNTPLDWLGLRHPKAEMPAPTIRQFDDGGYFVLRCEGAMAVLRYPRFRFRPSHADALHVDLWVNGENLLRDGGSFSYCAAPEVMNYFAGTGGHNTVQFDERDQMPKLGRFLWGGWLKTRKVEQPDIVADRGPRTDDDRQKVSIDSTGQIAEVTCGARYRDREGAWHFRRLSLTKERLRVHDDVGGFSRKAVARWRLKRGAWRIEGHTAVDGVHWIAVGATVPIIRFELVSGWESRYYLQRTETPVLEVEIHEPGLLTAEYRWEA